MARPTHNVVVVTGSKNLGKTDEQLFHTTIGAAWQVDTDNGIVMNIDLDLLPAKTTKITLFPIKEKKNKKS